MCFLRQLAKRVERCVERDHGSAGARLLLAGQFEKKPFALRGSICAGWTNYVVETVRRGHTHGDCAEALNKSMAESAVRARG